MSDLFDQVSNDQDPITKLMSKIPGFKGYVERATRRSTDKLLRDQISTQFSQLKTRITEIQEEFASAGELQYLDDLETAAVKIQTFEDKVSHAAYGYAGFFDAIKVKEEELAKLYEFDLAMIEAGEEIGRAIDNVSQSIDTDGLPAAIRHLISLTRDLVATYDRRDEVMTSVE